MIRKHNTHIVGSVQAAKVVVAIAILLGAAIVFMHRAAAQTTEDKKLAVDSESADPIDVNAMLQSALRQKLEFTRGEIEQIEKVGQSDADWIEELTHQCNDAKFVDRGQGRVWGDAAKSCAFLAEWGTTSLGAKSPEVELAYQRACALARAPGLDSVRGVSEAYSSEYGNFCAELGDLYRQRGDLHRALAIYQHAPNCHASGFEPPNPNLFEAACPLGADQILEADAINLLKRCTGNASCSIGEVEQAKRKKMEVDAEIHQLCTRPFSPVLPAVCSSHLNDWEQQAAVRNAKQGIDRANERADEEREQTLAAEQAHDANVKALVSTIQSMPGGNGPNAIVDAANQQAVDMVAVGAANDAARAQAAAQRREQIAEQQRAAQSQISSTSVAAVSPAGQPSAPLGSVNPEPPASQDGATPSEATAPQAGGSNSSGSDQFTSPMAPGCVRMFNDASMNGWVALQNTCSQKMTVTYVGRSGNGGVFGTMDLAPGGSDNTGHSPGEINAVGGINWYPCPYGYIPTTMDGHDAVTTPVTEYTCKSRGY